MNYAELGEKVKSKYKDYAEVDSVELGKRVASKYPEYQALITDTQEQAQPTTQAEPRKPLGMTEVGQILGRNLVATPQRMAQSIGRDASGLASGVTAGLARPAIQATTGMDIGEGSMTGKIVGSMLPVSKVGAGIRGITAAPKIIRGGLALAAEGAVGALGMTPEKSFEEFRNSAAQKAMTGALTSVAFGAGAKIISAVPKIAKEASWRTVNSLIKPLTKNFSFSKNPGRGIVEEGIVAKNLDELSDKVIKAETKVWGQLESKIKASNATLDLTDITNPIDDEITRLSKTPKSNSALISRLNDVKDDLLGTISAKGSVVRAGMGNLKNANAQKALELKQAIGDVTKWTNNPSEDNAVNSALKKVYAGVKNKLNKAVPGSEQLNERLADLISAKSAIRYRSVLAQRQNLVGLVPKMAGYLGAMGGGMAGGGPIGAMATPAAMFLAEKTLGSTLAKTAGAQALSGIGKASISPAVADAMRRAVTQSVSGRINRR